MPYRPDISNYLAHFTTNRQPVGHEDRNNPTNEYTRLDAKHRLISILENRTIKASSLPWVNKRAVCYTECPWASLIDHAERYSPYGIGFNKPLIFAAGGGPAFYVRADYWDRQTWEDSVKTFVTPFWPPYRQRALRDNGILNNANIDYSHEREWRVPHNFSFQYSQIEFVVVDTYQDMAELPSGLKDEIGRNKFLIMDVYRNIERLWPVHNMDT